MKFKKLPKFLELWYFRLGAIITWILVTIGILGTIGTLYALNIWDGLIFFALIIGSQILFYLMLKLMETPEIELLKEE